MSDWKLPLGIVCMAVGLGGVAYLSYEATPPMPPTPNAVIVALECPILRHCQTTVVVRKTNERVVYPGNLGEVGDTITVYR